MNVVISWNKIKKKKKKKKIMILFLNGHRSFFKKDLVACTQDIF